MVKYPIPRPEFGFFPQLIYFVNICTKKEKRKKTLKLNICSNISFRINNYNVSAILSVLLIPSALLTALETYMIPYIQYYKYRLQQLLIV